MAPIFSNLLGTWNRENKWLIQDHITHIWKIDNWNPVKFSLPGLKAELSLPESARTIIHL